MPMIILGVGSAIASGVGSIFSGRAQSAAMEQANQQAYQNWIRANTQKTFNNSREQFQAAYQTAQQLKRNSEIGKAAWQSDWENKQALQFRTNYQQKQLANQFATQRATLLNAMLAKGVSSSSGMYSSLAVAQSLDALNNANALKRNAEIELQNINKQTQAALSQKTENIFMPNIELFDAAPIYGDASAAAMGGTISGMLQIGGALAGAAAGSFGSPAKSTTSFNPNNNAYTRGTSGGSVGGR